jgi:biotin carboxylase
MKDFYSQCFLVELTQSPLTLLKIGCRWTSHKVEQHYGTLDLRICALPANYDGPIEDATDTALSTLVRGIWSSVEDAEGAGVTGASTLVILVPSSHKGYVCRSDFLQLRTGHSQFVDRVVAFAAWDHYLPPLPTSHDATQQLLALLACSPGALLLKEPLDQSIYDDMKARLSFQWLLPRKPNGRRVAVISGLPFPDRKRQMYNSQGYFLAAQALGISLVVVDNPGHWLEDSSFQHLRDEFVPVDMDAERLADLPQRLAVALKDKNLDGIVTFWDVFVIQTAEAAELLGLPTESSEALRQAHFKHEMRNIVVQPGIQTMTLDSVKCLDDPSMTERLSNLRYPVVVKPCRGLTSESVKKATCESSMREAVRMAFRDEMPVPGNSEVLIETYIDGPEFDANFMLWDGVIQFLEVTDSFPCAADAVDATTVDPFRETVQVSNSRLPSSEIEAIRTTLHRNILKLGFSSGVFHLEGRMQNSFMRYKNSHDDGFLDLQPEDLDKSESNSEVHAFLVEVNARPPGTGGTWATLFAYGVDQGALHFLRALDDGERFMALSKPYQFPAGSPGDGGGAQYWSAQCLVPIHRDGIRVPDDLWERAYQNLPDIVPYVTRAHMYAKPGTVVSMSRSVGWIGYVLLFSRTSRRHVLEMYHRLVETCLEILDSESQ